MGSTRRAGRKILVLHSAPRCPRGCHSFATSGQCYRSYRKSGAFLPGPRREDLRVANHQNWFNGNSRAPRCTQHRSLSVRAYRCRRGLFRARLFRKACPRDQSGSLAAVAAHGDRAGAGLAAWLSDLAGDFRRSCAAGVMAADPLPAAGVVAVGAVLAAFAGAWLTERWADGRKVFTTPVGIAKFCVLAFLPVALIGAAAAVGGRLLAPGAGVADMGASFTTWWLADAAGTLLSAPVLMLWATTALTRSTLLETAGVSLCHGGHRLCRLWPAVQWQGFRRRHRRSLAVSRLARLSCRAAFAVGELARPAGATQRASRSSSSGSPSGGSRLGRPVCASRHPWRAAAAVCTCHGGIAAGVAHERGHRGSSTTGKRARLPCRSASASSSRTRPGRCRAPSGISRS